MPIEADKVLGCISIQTPQFFFVSAFNLKRKPCNLFLLFSLLKKEVALFQTIMNTIVKTCTFSLSTYISGFCFSSSTGSMVAQQCCRGKQSFQTLGTYVHTCGCCLISLFYYRSHVKKTPSSFFYNVHKVH